MKVGLLSVGFLMLGVIAQQAGYYDLGEVAKPVEDLAGGAAKAGGALMDAAANGVPLPTWFLVLALGVVALRTVLYAPTADKVMQSRMQREADARAMEAKKADHNHEMERLRLEHQLRGAVDRPERPKE